ncbi:hypothetical protein ACJMK2_028871 [Sinanodonta woodiana]|uniref:Plasminogen n=1 Tax=Sinanodonta woodiana TaxID=1069815 RepID=A0ABD3XCA4_SINWO
MKIWGTFLLLCAVVVTVTSANMRNDILLESTLVDAYKTAYNNLRSLVQKYTEIRKDEINVGITIVSSACNKEIVLKLLRAEQDTLNTLETDLKAVRLDCKTSPPDIEHATVVVTKVSETQKVAKYTCNEGYTYGGGNKEVLCEGDFGVWGLANLQCIECFTTAYTYQGNKSITQGGIPCQRWDSYSPHQHFIESSDLPDQEISLAENYCRTPEFPEPWCYTTDPRMKWDYCGIPECNINNAHDCGLPQSLTNAKPRFTYTSSGARATYVCNSFSGSTKNSYCPVSQCNATGWSAASVSCSEQDCFIKSTEYTGKRSCTSSGRTCQLWTLREPHDHSYFNGPFPDDSPESAANYCRDPDGTGSLWCFTVDTKVRYEYCDVPRCDEML